jgi:hypothetical protein
VRDAPVLSDVEPTLCQAPPISSKTAGLGAARYGIGQSGDVLWLRAIIVLVTDAGQFATGLHRVIQCI